MAEQGKRSSLIVIDEDGDTLLILEKPSKMLQGYKDHGNDQHSTGECTGETITTENGSQVDTAKQAMSTNKHSEPIVCFQVSSIMLKNASSYFCNIFSGRFSESVLNSQDDKYHVRAQGFCPRAMEHTMNAIHVKTRRLPRKMDLETLADIAVLVDFYDLKDALSFSTDVWTKELTRGRFPIEYRYELWLRTFVTRSFGDERNFKRGAEIVIKKSEEPMPDLGRSMFGLPELLDKHRCDMIQMLIDEVMKLPNELKSGKWACSDACRAVLLGHFLLKCSAVPFSGQSIEVIQRPFKGLSFAVLEGRLWQCRKPPLWYGHEEDKKKGKDESKKQYERHSCGLERFLVAKFEEVESAFEDLLDDLK